ncbi:MAG: pilus assembly protein PilM, partial [Rubripirellula sp.]
AARNLNAVPDVAQSKDARNLRKSIDCIHWLSEQFDGEPYASPMLGRLAVRFAKEVPDDPSAKTLVQQLARELKQAKRPSRSHLPNWKAPREGWAGGDVRILGLPTQIELGEQREPKVYAGQFNVAFGLALQGLGHARVDQHFAPKKGLLSGLRRKENSCWGIDVGSASIKAALLTKDETGQIKMTDSHYQEYAFPTCRAGSEADDSAPKEALAKFIAEKELAGKRIWVNLPSSQLISRFLLLPPVKEKQAVQILDREIEQKFPIDAENLSVVRWMAESNIDEQGRPAVLAAAKRDLVEKRLGIFSDLELKIDGMQADVLSLVNFASHEFAELWTEPASDVDDAAASTDETEVDSNESQAFETDRSNPKKTTIVLCDTGASSTTIVVVSGEAHWSWTIESGGEDFTNLIARATKVPHAEAEKLKRNPAELSDPAAQYEAVEQRMDQLRVRLEKVVADALKQNPRFQINQTWCVGGGCNAHGWIRRVLLK